MHLSDELVSQFVKVTNDSKNSNDDGTVHGTIVEDGSRLCVQLDGSDVLTPIATTTEIQPGERVVVAIKNHTATVMGNTTNPAFGKKKVGELESNISQTAEEIRLEVANTATGLESKITQNADNITMLVSDQTEFSKFQQTVEGFSFMGTGGTVKINGGDLNLTGSITFTDLNEETQTIIENATPVSQFSVDGTGNWHEGMTDEDYYRRDSTDGGETWTAAYQFRGKDGRNGSDASVPGYIKSTYIDNAEIRSPTIKGNDVVVYGTFQTMGNVDGSVQNTGYMGAAKGMDGDGNATYGVALSNTWDSLSYEVGSNYIIVTNGGIRLQAGDNRLFITNEGLRINIANGGAYYNGAEIGSAGSVTAVWG